MRSLGRTGRRCFVFDQCASAIALVNTATSDAALALVREFERSAAVIVKHTNRCGAALAYDSAAVFVKALAGDPVSAFGGILAFNRRVTASLADVSATGFGE